MRGHEDGIGRRTGSIAWLGVTLALLLGLVAPLPVAAVEDDAPVGPVLATAEGPHRVGSVSTTVQLEHRTEPQAVEVWYPADPASLTGAPLAQHTFPTDVADVVRSLPIELLVEVLAVAGITDIEDLLDLVDQLGVPVDGLDQIRAVLPLLRLLGMTDIGSVLGFLGITDLGQLIDLLGFGELLPELTVPPVTAGRAVAGPDLAAGTHPLVVFSHDLGSLRWESSALVESLASHGYVVVAADHPGSMLGDVFGMSDLTAPSASVDQVLLDRARDVSGLIDAVAAGGLVPDLLAGRVDTGEVVLAGHALGGLTTLVAGAGRDRAVGAVAPDPRLAALVALSPFTGEGEELISDLELASVTLPTLLVGGTADVVAPIDPHVARPHRLISSDDVVRIDLAGVGYGLAADAFAGLDLGALLGLVMDLLGQLPPTTLPGVALAADVTPEDGGFLVGPFDGDAAARTYLQQAVAGFLLARVPVAPVEPTDPDPTDPDPTDPDPTDPDPTDPDEFGRPPVDPDGDRPAPPTTPRFSDVDPRSVHHDAILALVLDGVLRGYDDGTFRPGNHVTRAQLAAVVARSMGLAPGDRTAFPDVIGSVHAGDIGALAAVGVVRGFDDGTFRPDTPVRRDQVASVLARWLGIPARDVGPFADLDGNVHAGAVNALHAAGVVRGVTETRFGAEQPLRRDQFASLVWRARPLAP